jgi:glycosyltransferase involved in cell wall biosynthesis
MRILWHGVKSQAKTGYGVQTGLFVPALRDAGHEIAINARMDQYVTGIDEHGIVNFSSGAKWDNMGNDTVLMHAERYKPDIVLSMCDPFTCEPTVFDKVAWYPWVMVDSEPLYWANRECLNACRRPIAPTRNAVDVLQAAGYDPLYVPLVVDMDTYRTIDRQAARAAMGKVWGVDLSDKFVVVMNAANHSNPSRKNFGAAFRAFAEFEKMCPNALLYVHTEQLGKMWGGEDLRRVQSLYGVQNVVYAPQYEYVSGIIGDDYLVKMYNAADVLLCTSLGEGFGLPLVEAQACGCPVIVPDFGAMAELCVSGSKATGARYMRIEGSEQFLVDPCDVAALLIDANLQSKAPEARQLVSEAIQHYDIRAVMKQHMEPALDAIEQETRDHSDRSRADWDASCNQTLACGGVSWGSEPRQPESLSGMAAAV